MSTYLQFANHSGALYLNNTTYQDYTLGFGDLSHNYDATIVAMTSGTDPDNGWNAKPGVVVRYVDNNNYLRVWYNCSGDPGTIGLDGIVGGSIVFREQITATARLFPNNQLKRASIVLNNDEIGVFYEGAKQGLFNLNGSGSTLETDGKFGFTMVDEPQEPSDHFFLLKDAFVGNPQMTLFIEGGSSEVSEPAGAFYRYHANDTDGVDATSWDDSAGGTKDLGDTIDTWASTQPNLLSSSPPTGHTHWFDFNGTDEAFEYQLTAGEATTLHNQTEGTIVIYFKVGTLATEQFVLGCGWQTNPTETAEFRLSVTTGGELNLHTRHAANISDRTATTTTISTDTWYKAAIRVDATSTEIWIDGTVQSITVVDNSSGAETDWFDTIEATVTGTDPMNLVTLGGNRNGGGGLNGDLTGGIAYLAEWGTALTDAECVQLTDGTISI